MKKFIKEVASYPNEEKGVVHTKVVLTSTTLPIDPIEAIGVATCHEGDVFNEVFGVKLSTLRALRTTHKLAFQELDKVSKELFFLFCDCVNEMDAIQDRIEDYTNKINALIDSSKE